MNPFPLRILSCKQCFFEGECLSVTVPTADGLCGVLANHSNMVATLVPGDICIITLDNSKKWAEVKDGIVMIEDGKVLILTETIEEVEFE